MPELLVKPAPSPMYREIIDGVFGAGIYDAIGESLNASSDVLLSLDAIAWQSIRIKIPRFVSFDHFMEPITSLVHSGYAVWRMPPHSPYAVVRIEAGKLSWWISGEKWPELLMMAVFAPDVVSAGGRRICNVFYST